MKRKGGFLGVVLGVALVLLLIIGTVTLLAVSGKITVNEITPKKTAGKLIEIGRFSISSLEVKNVVGNVSVVRADRKEVTIKSNLPVKAQIQNNTLVVYCPEKRGILRRRNVCNDYRNGTVIIEIPEGFNSLNIHNVVGSVLIGAQSTRISISNIVGRLTGSAWGDYHVSGVVGNVHLNIKDTAVISNLVGNLEVSVPSGSRAVLNVEGILGKIVNNASGENRTVEVKVTHIVGNVSVGG